MPTSNFQPIWLLDPDYWYKFTYLMANSTEPDQLASQKPTDLDLPICKGRAYLGLAGPGLNF